MKIETINAEYLGMEGEMVVMTKDELSSLLQEYDENKNNFSEWWDGLFK